MNCYEIVISMQSETEEEKKLLVNLEKDMDIVVYSGDIGPSFDQYLINILDDKIPAEKIMLLLTTYGGSADAAYRTAKYLKRRYNKFILGVLGDCKSAGTILAFGADEIVMSPRGEFGPLDVQVYRPDEFVQRMSGMTISQALEYLSDRAFETFENIFLAIRRRSAGIITTQTAADIAASICGALFSPITEKIDPMRIGEMQRSMDIAIQYGIRLGGDKATVEALAKNYPCHSFVIDIEEAQQIFPMVREPNEYEDYVFAQLMKVMQTEWGSNFLRTPSDIDFVAIVRIVEGIESPVEGIEGAEEAQHESPSPSPDEGTEENSERPEGSPQSDGSDEEVLPTQEEHGSSV